MTYNVLGRWINLFLSMPEIRVIRKKYFEKMKNISDRPSLFRKGYVTLNTTFFFLAKCNFHPKIYAYTMHEYLLIYSIFRKKIYLLRPVMYNRKG